MDTLEVEGTNTITHTFFTFLFDSREALLCNKYSPWCCEMSSAEWKIFSDLSQGGGGQRQKGEEDGERTKVSEGGQMTAKGEGKVEERGL